MKKLTILLGLLVLSGQVVAANNQLLTVKFKLPDEARCTYNFFAEDGKVRYEPNPISANHCPVTLDMRNSSIDSISVIIPITHVAINNNAETCKVKVNRLSANSSYVYSFEGSNRDCGNKVKVQLD